MGAIVSEKIYLGSAKPGSSGSGAVESVNGKTGTVVLDASDVGALANTVKAGDIDGVAQLSTMPTASADNLDDIVQFIGTTDANYTNGYFYKCVSDGQNPATYSWTRTDVQPSLNALENTATGTDSLTILGTASTSSNSINIGTGSVAYHDYDTAIGCRATATGQLEGGVAVGYNAQATGSKSTAVGSDTKAEASKAIAIGHAAEAKESDSIAIGGFAVSEVSKAIQLGGGTNSDANTFKIANANGNFEMMDANGHLPADRIASTSGLADGNYRIRLTMASGVPTLSWVAE